LPESARCTAIASAAARQGMKNLVAGKAKNIINALVFLAPFHHFIAAVMAVAAHQDMDPGPMPADTPDDVLEDRARFLAGRRRALAQDHRHRLATRGLIDVDWQETAFVVMGVE
jgi:hypothetical protein